MKLNYNHFEEYGYHFDTVDDCIFYLQHLTEWLESHNKNYTKRQYYDILAAKEILSCFEVE